VEDLIQNLHRGSESIELYDVFHRVILEHSGCVSLVDFQSMANNALICIICAVHSCPLKGILAREPACGDPTPLRHPGVS